MQYSILDPSAPRPPDLLQQIEEDSRAARYRCYFYDLSDPKAAPRSLDLGGDNKEGLDGSGFGRSPSLCAVSPSTGLALVQRRNAGEVRTSPPYPVRDKEFEIYDLQTGNRVAFFGGWASPETKWIGTWDLHPFMSWLVTPTRHDARKQDGSGLLTVWDLHTGEALERIAAPPGSTDVSISSDGLNAALVSETPGIRIYRIKTDQQ